MVPEWASDHPPGRSGFLLQKLKNLRTTRTVDRLDMINECKGLVFFVYPPRRCTLVSCGLDFMLPLQHDREWPWKSSIARSSWIPWQGRDLPTFCLVREMYIVFTPPITKRLSLWQPGTSPGPRDDLLSRCHSFFADSTSRTSAPCFFAQRWLILESRGPTSVLVATRPYVNKDRGCLGSLGRQVDCRTS